MLDLRRLNVFKAVAEEGSFSAAALELAYTQSVVSHHVAELERELGVSLFERSRRPVRLTPAGERLAARAGEVLEAAAAAEADMRALAGMETGVLRVGAFLSACASFVPPAIAAFQRDHPDVAIRLEQREPPDALPLLISGDLDVAVVYQDEDSPERDSRLESAHLRDDAYRVVMHPGHRLARRRQIALGELKGERFSSPRPVRGGIAYRRMLERVARKEGFTPDYAYEVEDVSVARALAAAGLAIGVMPEMTVPNPRPDVAVVPVKGLAPFRQVEARWVRGRRVPGVAHMIEKLKVAA